MIVISVDKIRIPCAALPVLTAESFPGILLLGHRVCAERHMGRSIDGGHSIICLRYRQHMKVGYDPYERFCK